MIRRVRARRATRAVKALLPVETPKIRSMCENDRASSEPQRKRWPQMIIPLISTQGR